METKTAKTFVENLQRLSLTTKPNLDEDFPNERDKQDVKAANTGAYDHMYDLSALDSGYAHAPMFAIFWTLGVFDNHTNHNIEGPEEFVKSLNEACSMNNDQLENTFPDQDDWGLVNSVIARVANSRHQRFLVDQIS